METSVVEIVKTFYLLFFSFFMSANCVAEVLKIDGFFSVLILFG